jgi:hypothetical protein
MNECNVNVYALHKSRLEHYASDLWEGENSLKSERRCWEERREVELELSVVGLSGRSLLHLC